MKKRNKINERRHIIPSQIEMFNSSRHHSQLLISLSLHLNAIIIIMKINIMIIVIINIINIIIIVIIITIIVIIINIIVIMIIVIITCASPPCAPTPGHRIQILGAAVRTAFSAGISVAPATKPTHESSN